MATKGTSKTYEEILTEENAAGKKTYNETAAKTKGAAAQKIANQNAVIDSAAQNTTAQYQKTIDEAPKRFAAQLDDNYIDELVARKNLENSMADMGLTDSGLNRGQQTAISVMRGNADAKTRQQQQDYITAAQQAIDQVLAEAEREKASYANEINAGAEDYLAQLWTTVQQNAQANAANRYNAQLEAEAETERWTTELQNSMIQTLVKEGMSYEDAYKTVIGAVPQAAPSQVNGISTADPAVQSGDAASQAPTTITGVRDVVSGGYNSIGSWANQNLAAGLKSGAISNERAAEALYAQVVDSHGIDPYAAATFSPSGALPTSAEINNLESSRIALWNVAYDLGIEDEMAELCEVSLSSVPTKYTGGRTKTTSSGTVSSESAKPSIESTKDDGLIGWLKGFFSDYNTR